MALNKPDRERIAKEAKEAKVQIKFIDKSVLVNDTRKTTAHDASETIKQQKKP
jgi:hypothetical protein